MRPAFAGFRLAYASAGLGLAFALGTAWDPLRARSPDVRLLTILAAAGVAADRAEAFSPVKSRKIVSMVPVPSSAQVAVLVGDYPGLSPDELLSWFTDPQKLTRWWPKEAQIDLRPGGRYRLTWPTPGWSLSGEYVEVEAPSHIAFTWKWEHEATPVSKVDLYLSALQDGTRLAIWHRGYGDDWERTKLIEGWAHFGDRLRTILAELPDFVEQTAPTQ